MAAGLTQSKTSKGKKGSHNASYDLVWEFRHHHFYDILFIRSELGFPGGAVVENLPANAGDTGSSPGLGGSHMPGSNWAREPQLLSLRV